MLIGVIADDFTGASDIANTLSKGTDERGGLRTTQFLGIPEQSAISSCEAGVISLKTRSIATDDAVKQSLAALSWLVEQRCRQIIFKYCSTFDSTPTGNIGPVGEALALALGVQGVVACPAAPALNRTVYQGHLYVGDRLLNESGMERHPLNPMTDSDIRRWLQGQCKARVGHVPWITVSRGPQAITEALHTSARQRETLVIVDTLTDGDLLSISEACREARLMTGGSGVALGVPRNLIAAGLSAGTIPRFRGCIGPATILAGSCSRATTRQIGYHAKSHPAHRIDVDALMQRKVDLDRIVRFCLDNGGNAPLVFSSAPSDEVAALQKRYGAANVSRAIEQFFAELGRRLVEAGVRRLVVAGGETAGAVVFALDLHALTVGPEIDPGIPVMLSQTDPSLAIALKSGNFGSDAFFSKAVDVLGGKR